MSRELRARTSTRMRTLSPLTALADRSLSLVCFLQWPQVRMQRLTCSFLCSFGEHHMHLCTTQSGGGRRTFPIPLL